MAKEKDNSMILYYSQFNYISELSNENKGILLTALFSYVFDGDYATALAGIKDGETRMAFKVIRDRIDADKERYAEKCAKNKKTADEREAKKRGTKINGKREPFDTRRSKFIQEAQQHVRTYGQSMITEFVKYWIEPTPDGTLMRFELEKAWSMARRLEKWYSNE